MIITNGIHGYINILVDVNIIILYSLLFNRVNKRNKKRLGNCQAFLVFYYVLKVLSFGLCDCFHTLTLLLDNYNN